MEAKIKIQSVGFHEDNLGEPIQQSNGTPYEDGVHECPEHDCTWFGVVGGQILVVCLKPGHYIVHNELSYFNARDWA